MSPPERGDRLESRPHVRLGLTFVRGYARFFHRLEVLSPCPIPATGPAILVCNHVSGLDPVMLQSACPRLITWMMAAEYYRNPALNWLLRTIRAIPVERKGRDFAATRSALRALDHGDVLGVFPEGRISTSYQVREFQPGIALLAARSGAGVFPASIDGDHRHLGMLEAYLQPCRITVAFGHRLDLPAATDGPSMARNSQIVRAAVEQLHARVVSSAGLTGPCGT